MKRLVLLLLINCGSSEDLPRSDASTPDRVGTIDSSPRPDGNVPERRSLMDTKGPTLCGNTAAGEFYIPCCPPGVNCVAMWGQKMYCDCAIDQPTAPYCVALKNGTVPTACTTSL